MRMHLCAIAVLAFSGAIPALADTVTSYSSFNSFNSASTTTLSDNFSGSGFIGPSYTHGPITYSTNGSIFVDSDVPGFSNSVTASNAKYVAAQTGNSLVPETLTLTFAPTSAIGLDLGDFFGGGGHLGKGTGDAAHEREPEQGRDENHADAGDDPGRGIEEQAAGAQRGGGYDEVGGQGNGGRKFAVLTGAGENGHDDPVAAGVVDHESGRAFPLHRRAAIASGRGREIGIVLPLLGRRLLIGTAGTIGTAMGRVHAAAAHHTVMDGRR